MIDRFKIQYDLISIEEGGVVNTDIAYVDTLTGDKLVEGKIDIEANEYGELETSPLDIVNQAPEFFEEIAKHNGQYDDDMYKQHTINSKAQRLAENLNDDIGDFIRENLMPELKIEIEENSLSIDKVEFPDGADNEIDEYDQIYYVENTIDTITICDQEIENRVANHQEMGTDCYIVVKDGDVSIRGGYLTHISGQEFVTFDEDSSPLNSKLKESIKEIAVKEYNYDEDEVDDYINDVFIKEIKEEILNEFYSEYYQQDRELEKESELEEPKQEKKQKKSKGFGMSM